MALNPALDYATYLAANSTAGLTFASNGVNSVFVGPERPPSTQGGAIPVQAVFLHVSGGRPPGRTFNLANEIRYPHLQVMVRSTGYTPGNTLVEACYKTLGNATPTGYLDTVALHHPSYLGEDDRQYHHFVLNFELRFNSTY